MFIKKLKNGQGIFKRNTQRDNDHLAPVFNEGKLKLKSNEELIQDVKRFSLDNERLRSIIEYQREEIHHLINHPHLIERQEGIKTEDIRGKGTLLSWLEAIEKVPTVKETNQFRSILRDAFLNKNSKYYSILNACLVGLILFSAICVIMESVPSLLERWASFFYWSEIIVVGFFTIEYIINIYVVEDKLGYIFSIWGLIDLLAILPTYFYLMDLRDIKLARTLRIIRFLRTLRMMRVLKLSKNARDKYRESTQHHTNTLRIDLEIYATALFTVVIIFSTLIYYAERNIPDTPFTHIPSAMWWCLVTITTVGYGDMFPATIVGKLIASIVMIIGLALFGILMNVIGKAMITSFLGPNKPE